MKTMIAVGSPNCPSLAVLTSLTIRGNDLKSLEVNGEEKTAEVDNTLLDQLTALLEVTYTNRQQAKRSPSPLWEAGLFSATPDTAGPCG